ncbi:hypothetical protein G7Y89_g2545 [Cudoniella acicularis]|uniref:3'-5' exonuclease domain-containing protein n=1 Tax=Cudoniella acicularis TaxID=354080 RepID=A0A8H4RV55_9HELO|nr:hypothetical protein G7Y89_g2545 [Cudoniella acicularis]
MVSYIIKASIDNVYLYVAENPTYRNDFMPFTSNSKASGRSLSNDVFINSSKCLDWNDPHEEKYHSGMGCLWDIKTEIINTAKQIGDLVDWLILRHAPPEPYEPTMYIDLDGVNLCRKTLKDILQDEKIPKVFFDVRNDSDALFIKAHAPLNLL